MQEENKVENTEAEDQIIDLDAPQKDSVEEKEEIEVVEETTEDPVEETSAESKEELEDYSKGVQKRINDLTKKWREAERGQEYAYNYAKDLKNKYEALQQNSSVYEKNYLSEAESKLESQRAQTQKALEEAIADGDTAKQTKALDILTRISSEENKLKEAKNNVSSQEPVNLDDQFNQVFANQIQPPAPSQEAQDWISKQDFWELRYTTNQNELRKYGHDGPTGYVPANAETEKAMDIHLELMSNENTHPDFNPQNYYSELDKRVQKEIYGQRTQKNATQKVASANRAESKGGGKRQVRLTPSEVQMAKKLNVPLEEYARYKRQ